MAQLQTQLHQAQTRAASMTNAEAQVTHLRSQLQQQQAASEEQATTVAALTRGFDQERASWQQERSSLLARVKVAVPSPLPINQSIKIYLMSWGPTGGQQTKVQFSEFIQIKSLSYMQNSL